MTYSGIKPLNISRFLNWRTFLVLLIAPLVVIGFAFMLAWVQSLVRYNPTYFTVEYQERFDSPQNLLNELEIALQTGDEALMSELQGTRFTTSDLVPRPNIRFVMLLDRHGSYTNYLFHDAVNFHRYMAYIKVENGRYVVVPPGLYYYFDSGKWNEVFVPPVVMWWSTLLVSTAGIGIYRLLARERKRMFG
jgi:hypothetical protein